MWIQDKACYVQRVLQELFPDPKIPLYHTSPYTLLIAVLLSAQCTDARVNQVTPLLFARASTPQKMVHVDIEDIASIIRPCGLFRAKSRAIVLLSKQLNERFDGMVPDSLEALESLPGVGHKTASVVLTQAFSVPAFPVDTHIHRCAARWGLSSGRSVQETEKCLKQLFHKDVWHRIHLQMIYYARKYCPARGHKMEKCPICVFCTVQK